MRPHGKYAQVSTTSPEAFACCDRCGFWYNRSKLVWQNAWAGTHLFRTGSLVCYDRCYDIPNEQLRTIILPPDPPPVINSRVPDFQYEENGPVQTTLVAAVLQGATVLPVSSATGFVVGDGVWIQLNNATYGEETLIGVNTITNVLTIGSPLPFSAPNTGSVTVITPT
jgi:hypothetical protein